MTSTPQKPKYLSRYQREPERVPFQMTMRDDLILLALTRFLVLSVGQIKTLLFAENGTIQSTRRRLKILYHHGLLERVQPVLVPSGQGSFQTAYCLGDTGRKYLMSKHTDTSWPRRSRQVHLTHLAHALAVSQWRLQLEIALRDHPVVELHRCIGDWEMKSHQHGLKGNHRYRLYHQVEVAGTPVQVYPDCLFILRGKGDLASFQKLFLVEIDRGTMGLRRVREKVLAYAHYRTQRGFCKWGQFKAGFTLLIQTTSNRRARNMRDHLKGHPGEDFTWITAEPLVTEHTILTQPIWTDHTGTLRQVLKTP